MSMTLEEAIEHAEDIATSAIGCECREEHRQLAIWLRELQEIRKDRDYWQEKANSYEQTIFKLTDAISKQPEIVRCGECKHNGTHNCLLNLWATIFNSKPKDDFFCGMAERKIDD